MEQEVPNLYTPDQVEQQRIGAKLLIVKLLSEVRPDWNAYGFKIALRQELKELDDE